MFCVNGGDDVARRRIDYLPEILITERQIHSFSIGRDLHAVRICAEVFTPIDFVRFQVETDQFIFFVGSNVQLAKLYARCDTFVVAAIRNIDFLQQLMTVIDIVDTDSAFVRDVQPPLPVRSFAVCPLQIARYQESR